MPPQKKPTPHRVADQFLAIARENASGEVVLDLEAKVFFKFRTKIMEFAHREIGASEFGFNEKILVRGGEFLNLQIVVDAVRNHVWEEMHAVGKRVIPGHKNSAIGGTGGERHIEKRNRPLLDEADRSGRAVLGIVEESVELPHLVMAPIDIIRMFETNRLQLIGKIT